jgi:uncharacterized protein (TIGR02598 family)
MMVCARSNGLKAGGFTLAESLFAVGIVASALLAIVAVVPVGLDNLIQVERRTAEARIFRSLLSEHEALPVLTGAPGSGRRRFFDLVGLEVTQNDERTAYMAESQLVPVPQQPAVVSRQAPAAPGNSFLYKVEVTITPWEGGAANPLMKRVYASLVVDTEP